MATSCGGSSKSTTPNTLITATKSKPGRPKNPNKPHHTPTKQQLLSLLSSVMSASHSFLSQNDLHLLPSQSLSLHSLLNSLPFPPPHHHPQHSFFHRLLSSPSADWPTFFRMSKPTFFHLLSILSPPLISSLPPSIPPDSAIAAALFRLSHGASYEFVAESFGLDSSEAACLAFYSVCKAVNEKLSNLVEFRQDLDRILVGFGWISLPNCCGVLGFGRFGVNSDLLGENGSLLVQALVDSEGRFLDISAGWPCTMQPSSIFKQSKLFSGINESRELLNGPCYDLGNGNSIPQYILGDLCLPLLPWLLTPYIGVNEEGGFGLAAREFNNTHRRAMGLVATAFGRVKARWQLLAKRWKEETVEFYPFVIVMGCLLHNFLIKCGEPLPEGSVGCFMKEGELPVFEGEADGSGLRIRDTLSQHLSRRCVFLPHCCICISVKVHCWNNNAKRAKGKSSPKYSTFLALRYSSDAACLLIEPNERAETLGLGYYI